MKLVTTVAGFDMLGPHFVWNTELWSEGKVENGSLTAPLVLRGGGDPKFTWEHLELLLQKLRAAGVERLPHGVIVDRSLFAPIKGETDAFDGHSLKPYNALPDAMLFNFKAVGFKFIPNERGGVTIETKPHPTALTLRNELRLVKTPCGEWRDKLRATFHSEPANAQARFAGTYSVDCGEREWFQSMLSHQSHLAGSLAWMWQQLGGKDMGPVRDGPSPSAARLLVRQASAPLTVMASSINKYSNNVMTRMLLLTLDWKANGPPARAERGDALVKTWLKRKSIAMPALTIENGSGLSRSERLTSVGLSNLLRFALAQPYANEFLSALSVYGEDGTVNNSRYGRGQLRGQAYLKTGTLNDVRALAGIIRLPDNRLRTFSILINHPNANAAAGAIDAALIFASRME